LKAPGIWWISSGDPPDSFPDVETAFAVPDGLLAAGGDLSDERLLHAYGHGIFPWYSEGQPILWWSPDPRCVIAPAELRISRRLRRSLRNSGFEIRFNSAFAALVTMCAANRPGQDGTWITAEMAAAYSQLQRRSWAHSIEVWLDDRLVGGLYGLAIGRVFFGESMVSQVANASKAAMLALCMLLAESGFTLLDCQVESPHLMSLGATLIPRKRFSAILAENRREPDRFENWPAKPRKINDFLA
jgi:leucyl/phenylalanyl-tRNA--protein transferase